MFLSRRVEGEIKKRIVEGYAKEDILGEITKKHGKIKGLTFFYDCCYNTVCQELGINRKKGEELKPKKVRIITRRGK